MRQSLEALANRVKDAMFDAEKTFDEVRRWSDTRKQDFIPVRNLTDKLNEALSELKNERRKRERKIGFTRSLS